MANWMAALKRTRASIADAFQRVIRGGGADHAAMETLEESLLRADVSAALAAEFLDILRGARNETEAARRARMAKLLSDQLPRSVFSWAEGPRPRSILVVGVNGSGKTTTCAKLARRAMSEGMNPLLCAADTFRAAGTEQLRIWAERLGCDVVSGRSGSDAAAVAFDAMDAAVARGRDVLIVDTAGRMHTRQPLMEELSKVRRAMSKRLDRAPDETWIVLDAALGRNAISQARQFHGVTPLTGVIVSKLDGSSKAGFVFSIARELNIPLVFAGLGEGADDLVPFDPESFSASLIEENHAR